MHTNRTLFIALMVSGLLAGLLGLAGIAGAASPTQDNPLVVDADASSVTILATVNGKYFYQPTRHCVIYSGGNFGDKPIFKTDATPESFYNALKEIGAVPGENMTLENKETTHVQGDPLDVAVTWDGADKAYTLDEVIVDSNGKPISIRFGGNLAASKAKNTGCLVCLDSCPVGIASNDVYSYGAVEIRDEVGFMGNKKVLPGDGSPVLITFKVAK